MSQPGATRAGAVTSCATLDATGAERRLARAAAAGAWLRHLALVLSAASTLLAPSLARAQSSGDTVLVPVLLPPAVVALSLDVAAVVALSSDGTARRGFAITGIVFSAILAGMSAGMLFIGYSSNSSEFWKVTCGAGIAFGLASLALNVLALKSVPPEPEPPAPEPAQEPRLRARPPAPPPVQLRDLLILPTPVFGPSGSVGFGGAMSFRW